jgi:hypothetical protein
MPTFSVISSTTTLSTVESRKSGIVNNSSGINENASDITTNTSAISALVTDIAAIPAGATGETGAAFTYADFTTTQLKSLKGATGSIGKIGPLGPTGSDGSSGADGSNGDSAFTAWKREKGFSDSEVTETDFIKDIKGFNYKDNVVTKKSHKIKKAIKVSKKRINESNYITVKDGKGKVKAVAISHDVIIGSSSSRNDFHLTGDAVIDGDLQISGDIGSFSDVRLKKNIVPLKDSLEKLHKITPVIFNWITSDEEETGFIAQNIQDIAPELVFEDKTTGLLKLKITSPMWNAIIIQSIQEQQKIINTQQYQIDELKNLVLELTKNNT